MNTYLVWLLPAAVVVATGVLVTQGWLDGTWADTVLFIVGGGAGGAGGYALGSKRSAAQKPE